MGSFVIPFSLLCPELCPVVLLKYFQAFIVYSFLQETAAHEIDFIRLSVRSQPGMEAAVVVASASSLVGPNWGAVKLANKVRLFKLTRGDSSV